TIKTTFWPDQRPSKASSNFHTTLYRARQALGNKDVIILDEEQYRFNSSVNLWYDVNIFTRYIREAEKMVDPYGKMELLRQATKM
ncbi:MAG: hypothetical protein ACK2T5_05140, partial [Anaerolineales bacterium]